MKKRIQFWIDIDTPISFAFDETFEGEIRHGSWKCHVVNEEGGQYATVYRDGNLLIRISLLNNFNEKAS